MTDIVHTGTTQTLLYQYSARTKGNKDISRLPVNHVLGHSHVLGHLMQLLPWEGQLKMALQKCTTTSAFLPTGLNTLLPCMPLLGSCSKSIGIRHLICVHDYEANAGATAVQLCAHPGRLYSFVMPQGMQSKPSGVLGNQVKTCLASEVLNLTSQADCQHQDNIPLTIYWINLFAHKCDSMQARSSRSCCHDSCCLVT